MRHTIRLTMIFGLLAAAELWLATARGEDSSRKWIPVGTADIQWNYTYMFSLGLAVPYGQTSIEDIKQGLVPLRFTLKWLPPVTSQEKIANYFTGRLQHHFANPEAFQRNLPVIQRLLKKLPPAQKHDLWHIVYDPDAGTLFFVADQKVHHVVGAHLNRALLNNWLNDNPVTTAQLLNRLIQRQNAR